MSKQKLSVSIDQRYVKILDKYCEAEIRTRSNMIEALIEAYSRLDKQTF